MLSMAAICSFTIISAQNLTPAELTKVHDLTDVNSITPYLQEKGFRYEQTQGNTQTKETTTSWSFSLQSGQKPVVAAFVQKTFQANEEMKTVFTFYTPFHGQHFINNLLKENYQFSGTEIIDGRNYFAFTNHRKRILIIEKHSEKGNYFGEIIVETVREKAPKALATTAHRNN